MPAGSGGRPEPRRRHYRWAGTLFNPCGRVKINNHDSAAGTPDLVGTIYGFEVEINGDGFNQIGTDDFDPRGRLHWSSRPSEDG